MQESSKYPARIININYQYFVQSRCITMKIKKYIYLLTFLRSEIKIVNLSSRLPSLQASFYIIMSALIFLYIYG